MRTRAWRRAQRRRQWARALARRQRFAQRPSQRAGYVVRRWRAGTWWADWPRAARIWYLAA